MCLASIITHQGSQENDRVHLSARDAKLFLAGCAIDTHTSNEGNKTKPKYNPRLKRSLPVLQAEELVASKNWAQPIIVRCKWVCPLTKFPCYPQMHGKKTQQLYTPCGPHHMRNDLLMQRKDMHGWREDYFPSESMHQDKGWITQPPNVIKFLHVFFTRDNTGML